MFIAAYIHIVLTVVHMRICSPSDTTLKSEAKIAKWSPSKLPSPPTVRI